MDGAGRTFFIAGWGWVGLGGGIFWQVGVDGHFYGWVGVGVSIFWVGGGGCKYILGGWRWVDIFLWVGGGGWRYILDGWTFVMGGWS